LQKNHLVIILPMTNRWDAKLALRRAMRVLNLKPIKIHGIPVETKVAGVLLDLDLADVADANFMADQLSTQISDMAMRIKNIHACSG
jgi:hypothetical protein